MNKNEINLARCIRFGLAALFFVLASCSSKPTQTAVILTKTPEATATATIEPTATIAPKPDYITDDNSVETDDGIVFVNDGKAMLYDSKTGEIREIKDISTEVTFDSMNYASDIVLAMHVEEFANQIRADFLPREFENNPGFIKSIDRIGMMGLGDFGYAQVVGKNLESVKVKNPTQSADFPVVAVVMLNVYGYEKPFPYIVGLFDTQENFAPIQQTKAEYSSTNYPYGQPLITNYPDSLRWEDYQKMVADNFVVVDTLATVPVGNESIYHDPWLNQTLPQKVKAERDDLVALQVSQAEAGFDYLVNQDGEYQTGAVYSAIDSKSGDTGLIIVDMYGRLVVLSPSTQ